MVKKGLQPRYRIGFNRPESAERFHEVFPIKRSLVGIIFILVFDVIFLIPTVSTFQQAVALWSKPGDLFSLVSALFITFWLLGWSIAPLLLTTLLALLLFGREELRAGRGSVTLYLGLPFAGVFADYDVRQIRYLRIEHPLEKSGRSWRGPHAVFDYGANTVAFGTQVDELQLASLQARIEMATGSSLRKGDARPEELELEQAPEPPAGMAAQQTRPEVEEEPVTLASPTVLALVLANCVPLLGAVYLDWDLGAVMVIYWAESAVIGFFNLLKMAVIGGWKALLAGPFFVGHFGGFMAVHFLFLYTLFIEGLHGDTSPSGDLGDVALLFIGLWPALAALVISHGYSFFANFIGRQEYLGMTVKKQMSEPYGRIIFMHMVLIIGGGLAMFLGDPKPVLLMVIVLKVFFDVRAHLRQRRRGEDAGQPARVGGAPARGEASP